MKKALLWIGPILIVVGLFMALGASTSIAKIKENEKINGLADAMSLSDRDLCVLGNAFATFKRDCGPAPRDPYDTSSQEALLAVGWTVVGGGAILLIIGAALKKPSEASIYSPTRQATSEPRFSSGGFCTHCGEPLGIVNMYCGKCGASQKNI